MENSVNSAIDNAKSVLQDLLSEVKAKQFKIDNAANGLVEVLVELSYLTRKSNISPEDLKEIESMVLKINGDLRT